MRPLKPGQCLLLTDANVMYARNGRLWLNNVYIRLRMTERARSTGSAPALVSVTDAPSGRLYMTNVTLQGSSTFPSTGLYITSAAYIAGVNHPALMHHLTSSAGPLRYAMPLLLACLKAVTCISGWWQPPVACLSLNLGPAAHAAHVMALMSVSPMSAVSTFQACMTSQAAATLQQPLMKMQLGGYTAGCLASHSHAPDADSEFINLGIRGPPVRVLVEGASASFERCTFLNNTVPPSLGIITMSLHAVALRLQNCSFDSSGGPDESHSLVDANGTALVYSDDVRDVWLTADAARRAGVGEGNSTGVLKRTLPLSAVPRTVLFLDDSDVWLQDVQQVRRLTLSGLIRHCTLHRSYYALLLRGCSLQRCSARRH